MISLHNEIVLKDKRSWIVVDFVLQNDEEAGSFNVVSLEMHLHYLV